MIQMKRIISDAFIVFEMARPKSNKGGEHAAAAIKEQKERGNSPFAPQQGADHTSSNSPFVSKMKTVDNESDTFQQNFEQSSGDYITVDEVRNLAFELKHEIALAQQRIESSTTQLAELRNMVEKSITDLSAQSKYEQDSLGGRLDVFRNEVRHEIFAIKCDHSLFKNEVSTTISDITAFNDRLVSNDMAIAELTRNMTALTTSRNAKQTKWNAIVLAMILFFMLANIATGIAGAGLLIKEYI
jgi:hypothetical protein